LLAGKNAFGSYLGLNYFISLLVLCFVIRES